jgi:hypothetical protein
VANKAPRASAAAPAIEAKSEPKAVLAVAHTMLGVVGHVLARQTAGEDLGLDYFQGRTDTQARQRCLVRQLEALGHQVTLQPAA